MRLALSDANGHGRPVEVLLVEDDPDDVELTTEVLGESRLPARVSVCRDGEEAMAYLRAALAGGSNAVPDLILLDLNMPRMNGFEVLVALKADRRLAHIPVVVLTTSDDERDILESYSLHANCVVTKPSHIDDFVEIVNEIEAFWFNVARIPGA